MMVLIPLVVHLLMSLMMFALTHVTRREILFGVALPADFRSGPEGRKAIRVFRFAVLIPAVVGAIAIAFLGSRFIPVFLLAPMTMMLAGMITFVVQNRKLRPFAVQPQPVRELELSTQPERLPWFTWLGLAPLVFLAAAALYLYANWDSIPASYPRHWGLDGQPDQWANRSLRGVYSPLILGAEMTLWLFGFALATWYGSRRSEPLRRPAVGVFVTLGWMLALLMPGLAIQPLIKLPIPALVAPGMAIILLSVIYLIKKSREARGPLDPTPNECWKGGILYYNPNDSAIFVGRRDGAGFTLNMGNRWSWAVLGSPLVLMASAFGALLLP
jgi:uncharacterized membrane protein